MESSAIREFARRALPGAKRTVAAVAVFLVASSGGDAGAMPFSNGLLWRVSRTGVADSFVLGTIHIADPRVSMIPPPVDEALARARDLAMEIVPGPVSDPRLFELEEFDDGRRLEPLIGSEAFAQVREELIAKDVPARVIDRLKPWAAMMKLARSPPSGDGISLDERLFAAARTRRMRVWSLEGVEEQIASFDAIPMDSQVALLKHVLAYREAHAATLEPTIDAWLRGDLSALARISERAGRNFPDMSRHFGQLTKHIVHNRTILMHHRLFLPLRGGRVFVAVGAMHLHGDRGLLAILKKDGYRITRVW